MTEENKYDQESIRELLTWAQSTLNNKTYPEGGMVLDKCIKVIDCKSHIEATYSVASIFCSKMHILFCVNKGKLGTKCFLKMEQFVLPFVYWWLDL